MPTASPVPPPSGIGGAPRSPATWSEPHGASNGMLPLAQRRDRVGHRLDHLRVGDVEVARGVRAGRSGRTGSATPGRRGPPAATGSRSTNSSKMCAPTESASERPSQSCSTWQASVSPVASQTVSRAPPSRITSAASTRFSCSWPRRLRGDSFLPRRQPVEHVVRHHPGAHRADALLAADDPGVPLERLLGVRQPVGVVGVHHPVAAHLHRQVRRARRSPAARRPRRCATRRSSPRRCRRGRAGRRPGRARGRPASCTVCARSSGTLGTTEWSAYTTSPCRSAAVVLTHGMPAARVLAAQQVAHAGGLAHLEEGVDRAQVLAVGVADRPDARRPPRHQRRRRVDDVALRRPVEVLGRRCRASRPSAAPAPSRCRGSSSCGPASVR